MKLQNSNLSWEAYKYLSRNVLTDKELDVFYFLTHHYIEKEGFDKLFPLLDRAKEEKITADEEAIKKYIKEIDLKKRLSH